MYDLIEAIKKSMVQEVVSQFLKSDQLSQLSTFVDSLETLYICRALGKTIDEKEVVKSAEKMVRIAIALESELFLMLNEQHTTEEFSDAYYLIANIMEYAARVHSDSEKLSLEYWLRASIAYYYAGYTANSTFCAVESTKSLSPDRGVENSILRLIIYFLARRFKEFENVYSRMSESLNSTIQVTNEIDSQQKYFLRVGLSGLVNSADVIIRYLVDGKQDIRDTWLKSYKRDEKFIQKSGDDLFGWIASRLYYIYLNSIKWSLWSSRDIIPEEIIQALTHNEEPIYELWPNQEKALRDISLQDKWPHALITMPTSAGKTLVAAILLAKELLRTAGNAFYVTSLRALVDEISEFFAKYFASVGLSVAYLPGDYDSIPNLEALVGQNARIIVLTPEKLDLLWRINDIRLSSASVFVFDEVQLIRERGRGLRLELLASKIAETYGATARIMLLSGVIPHSNLIEFMNWLSSGSTKHLETTWTPTRIREGYFFRLPSRNCAGNIMYFRSGNKTNTLVIHDVLPPAQHSKTHTDSAHLAWKYHRNFGPVLVYANRRTETEKIAQMIFGLAKENSGIPKNGRLLEAAEQIRKILPHKFLLPDMVEYGIAYHHASLPDDVKHIIQHLAKNRDLNVIVSTTTLAEGVNLNLKSVIISDSMAGGERMDGLRLRNLAGRAGRALRDTEGHVILMQPDLTDDLLDINRSRIRSRLFNYLEAIIQEAGMDTDADALESNLLARAYKKEFTRRDIKQKTHKIISSTFFSRQANTQDFKKVYDKIIDKATNVIDQIDVQEENVLRVFAETGLALDPCNIMNKAAKQIANDNDCMFRLDSGEMNWDLLDMILRVCINAAGEKFAQEIRKTVRNPTTLLKRWLLGDSVVKISSYVDPTVSADTFRKISYFLYGFVINDVSWTAAAFVKLLTHHIQVKSSTAPIDKEWELFPNYLKYGTINPAALLLMITHAEERDSAIEQTKLNKLIPKSSYDWLKLIGWTSYTVNNNPIAFKEINQNLILKLSNFTIPLNLTGEYENLQLLSDGSILSGNTKITSIDDKIVHLMNSIKICTKYKTMFLQNEKGEWEMNVTLC